MAEGPDVLKPIGRVESPLVDRDAAPKQEDEGSTATCWWCIRATTRRPRNGTPHRGREAGAQPGVRPMSCRWSYDLESLRRYCDTGQGTPYG